VRHLVELHGGTVSAESRGIGCGATFRVVLPVVPARSGNMPPVADIEETAADEKREPRRLDRLRVLVVDDEPHARELFSAIVETAGAETRQATSADEVRDVLAAWWPDVLLSDVEMPDEDGYTLMEHVNALAVDPPPIAAIAVTAHSRPDDRRRAIEAGFKWHLPKPVEPSELIAVIAALTDRPQTA
jgi:CheY-like chemotaxis protein